MSRGINVRTPEKYREKLEKAKGEGTWLSLLIDGAKHRGEEIEFVPIDRTKYKHHYYCSHCEIWIPHEKGVYEVARAFVRCPECFLPLRTRGLKSTFNYEELEC